MMTVHEVSSLTGVSARTLRHYDSIGLLKPAAVSPAGYRLYDEDSLERLQQILLFRALEFPLAEIKQILDSPDFDRSRALEQQIRLLELRREHIDNLIILAKNIKLTGVRYLSDFTAFDTRKIDEYAAEAKASWGKTDAYREYEQKAAGRTKEETIDISERMMQHFARFGKMLHLSPADPAVQDEVRALQDFITENFYTCTPEILAGLGRIYSGGGDMTENIDRAGGSGTAEFAARAIEIYCKK